MKVSKLLPGLFSVPFALAFASFAQGCGGNVIVCEGEECDGTTTDTTSGTGGTTSGTGGTTSSSTAVPQSAIEKVCEKACSCAPDECSSSSFFEECVKGFQQLNDDAQTSGCQAEFGVAFSCYEDNLVCQNGTANADACMDEIQTFTDCLEGPLPDPNACDELVGQIIDKYGSCGIIVEPGGEPTDCTQDVLNQLQCVTPCINEAPCSVFGDNPPPEDIAAYSDCINACQP